MPGPQKLTLGVLGLGAALALALGGCGGDDENGLARLAPPDTPFFIEVALSGEGTEAVFPLAQRIGGLEDPGGELVDAIDSGLAGQNVEASFSEDIEPWLGERAGLFIRSFEPSALADGDPDAAYLIETTDPDDAQTFLDALTPADGEDVREREYEGVGYRVDPSDGQAIGLVDSTVVGGTEPAFRAAVDAAAGDSLATAEDFSEQVGDVKDGTLAEAWVSLGTALDAAAEIEGADGAEVDAARAALGDFLSEPLTVSIAATEEAITVETSAASGLPLEGNTERLSTLPADAWLALTVEEAGSSLNETLTGVGGLAAELGDVRLSPEAVGQAFRDATGLRLEEDLLAWIGDASAYVAGTSPLSFSAGAILDTDDGEASQAAIGAAREAFESSVGILAGPPELETADAGFAATGPGFGFEVVLADDQVVAAFGGGLAAGLLEPEANLASDEAFARARRELGDEFGAITWLVIPDFLTVAEAGGSGADPDFVRARPFLESLEYLLVGTDGGSGERQRSRTVIGVGE